jgi:hypothetical protein
MVFGHSGAMKSRYTMHWGAYLYRKPPTDFTDEAKRKAPINDDQGFYLDQRIALKINDSAPSISKFEFANFIHNVFIG